MGLEFGGESEVVEALEGDGDVGGINFDGAAVAFGVVACDEGGSAAAEWVEDDVMSAAGVLDGALDEFDGFHGGVFWVFLGLVDVPDGGLGSAAVVSVGCAGFPSVEYGFGLPVVVDSHGAESGVVFDPLDGLPPDVALFESEAEDDV